MCIYGTTRLYILEDCDLNIYWSENIKYHSGFKKAINSGTDTGA
jgi:hypothetical protein